MDTSTKVLIVGGVVIGGYFIISRSGGGSDGVLSGLKSGFNPFSMFKDSLNIGFGVGKGVVKIAPDVGKGIFKGVSSIARGLGGLF